MFLFFVSSRMQQPEWQIIQKNTKQQKERTRRRKKKKIQIGKMPQNICRAVLEGRYILESGV